MSSLQEMFPSLTLFSDLDWEAVTEEYRSEFADLSFPEYLQQKALDGDCPLYLFELAFYELAVFDIKSSTDSVPKSPGIYLNPTALFLSLEFDVKKMLLEASLGNINVFEKEHVLCIYKDQHDVVQFLEVTDEDLDLLQHLEEGPQKDKSFVSSKHQHSYQKFDKIGLILDLI